jgi:hypothetical protein
MNNANTPEEILEKLKQALTEITSKEHSDSERTVVFRAKKGESNYGKGIVWAGQGPARQFVFSKPDSFWSSESIDLAADKSYYVGGSPVINQTSLGSSVVKSNLKDLGRLNGLIVDGSVSIAQHFYYDAKTRCLGLGNERPNSPIDVVKDGVNLTIDVTNNSALVGTKTAHNLDLSTDNIARISVNSNGAIQLGNRSHPPVDVAVHGKISIKVEHPDPDVDLHVNGPVRLHGRLFAYADKIPNNGTHQQGDIIWNSKPIPGRPVGWVCVHSGTPGAWASFGTINHLG